MEKVVCGAITRQGTPCQKTPLKNGRCKLHGGKSTGPKDRTKQSERMKGNKNAVKTRQYETLWAEQFTGKYKELYESAPTDPLENIDVDISKNEVRQMMISDDISELKQSNDKRKTDLITRKEEALTSVQNQKIRLLETKIKILEFTNKQIESEGDGSLDRFSAIMEKARKEYKGKKQGV